MRGEIRDVATEVAEIDGALESDRGEVIVCAKLHASNSHEIRGQRDRAAHLHKSTGCARECDFIRAKFLALFENGGKRAA